MHMQLLGRKYMEFKAWEKSFKSIVLQNGKWLKK